jgi:hypothetical protein
MDPKFFQDSLVLDKESNKDFHKYLQKKKKILLKIK